MFKNYWKHFKLITKHKYYVFKNCCYAGIPLQGIVHDLSKYSPTEFLESVKNYSGDRSPIDNLKDKVYMFIREFNSKPLIKNEKIHFNQF